jgi:heptosyltransferase-2
MPRAILIKFGAIGDVLMAIPAARALHAQGYHVDWVCGTAVQPLLALYPWINAIPADDRAILTGSAPTKLRALTELWRKLPRAPYDLCATLYYDPRYKLLALPIRSKRKLMLSTTDRNFQLLPGRHHTDEYARILLARPDGEQPASLAPVRPARMPPSPLPPGEKPRILLAPAGARNMLRDDQLRRWPLDFYVETARQLLEQNLEVVLAGGPDDRWASAAFASLAVIDTIGQFTLSQTLGLMDAAQVLITHDTGPLHLAGVTDIGLIGLFGPTDPHGRQPRRPRSIGLWGGETFACRPCYDGRDFAPCLHNGCLHEITPGQVVAHTLTLLGTPGTPFRILNIESTPTA